MSTVGAHVFSICQILLNELGFDESLLVPLREDYLNPLCKLLYPEWCGDTLDSHKAFVVTYKIGEDLDLSYHYDNAEVTLNVSLGREFSEGSLKDGDFNLFIGLNGNCLFRLLLSQVNLVYLMKLSYNRKTLEP